MSIDKYVAAENINKNYSLKTYIVLIVFDLYRFEEILSEELGELLGLLNSSKWNLINNFRLFKT